MFNNNRMLFGILTMAMSTVGTVLIAKDDNTTGTDDVCGNMLLAGASAFDGVQTGNQSKFDNALVRVWRVADGYLRQKGINPAA